MLSLAQSEKKQANFYFRRVLINEEKMHGELLVWENLLDKESESEMLGNTSAQYFHQTEKFFYSEQQEENLPIAERTYYVINLRSDMVSQQYTLSHSSLSYFGDAGGVLTLLYAIGRFL